MNQLRIGYAAALSNVLLIIGVIVGVVSPFLSLLLVVLGIVAIIKALQGERWRIPLVADLTDQW